MSLPPPLPAFSSCSSLCPVANPGRHQWWRSPAWPASKDTVCQGQIVASQKWVQRTELWTRNRAAARPEEDIMAMRLTQGYRARRGQCLFQGSSLWQTPCKAISFVSPLSRQKRGWFSPLCRQGNWVHWGTSPGHRVWLSTQAHTSTFQAPPCPEVALFAPLLPPRLQALPWLLATELSKTLSLSSPHARVDREQQHKKMRHTKKKTFFKLTIWWQKL
jgi:hypothetical protein